MINGKNTLRVMISLACNFRCKYCCNHNPDYNSRFTYIPFEKFDPTGYENICVSGGEPFLNRVRLYKVLDKISLRQPVYLYTNAVLINEVDIIKLISTYPNVLCLNVGIHSPKQINYIHPGVGRDVPVRWMFWEGIAEAVLKNGQGRILPENSKVWKMNVCNVPNEEWVVLK